MSPAARVVGTAELSVTGTDEPSAVDSVVAEAAPRAARSSTGVTAAGRPARVDGHGRLASVRSARSAAAGTSGSDATGSISTPSGPIVHSPTRSPSASKTAPLRARPATCSAGRPADRELVAEGDDGPVVGGVFGDRRGASVDVGARKLERRRSRRRVPTSSAVTIAPGRKHRLDRAGAALDGCGGGDPEAVGADRRDDGEFGVAAGRRRRRVELVEALTWLRSVDASSDDSVRPTRSVNRRPALVAAPASVAERVGADRWQAPPTSRPITKASRVGVSGPASCARPSRRRGRGRPPPSAR